ncbi:MAG: Gfo/Idh/MocA family oxidoreductase, partial [Verrucomicrobia bacterium]|nr:Gfo/Idh/MocA family oxidoreductase [Verrucomicrobiota bacterium]
MSKVITVAIAGFGRSGYGIHTNWLKQDPSKYKIVAVADKIAERRQDAVNELGCQVFEDYKDMLTNVKCDLFINATPSRFHLEAT